VVVVVSVISFILCSLANAIIRNGENTNAGKTIMSVVDALAALADGWFCCHRIVV